MRVGVLKVSMLLNAQKQVQPHSLSTPIQPAITEMSSTNGTTGGPPPESSSNGFNPSMAIIIVVLIVACLVVAIFSMYIRRCTQGEDTNRAPSRSQSIHFFERPGEALERSIIDSLPIVSFSVVKTLKAGKEDLECAVCLEKFEDEESLRLLPKCSHVFHTECIDEWFKSHSTCPLCRTSLKVTVEEINAGVPAVGEVSRRILEAQEELFGSSRLAGSVLDENEVFDGKLEWSLSECVFECISEFQILHKDGNGYFETHHLMEIVISM